MQYRHEVDRAGKTLLMESTSNPPLVIVSEHGKHDKASRRIVRAQAARASASQSRLTRARNREDRLSHGSRPRSNALPQSHLRRFQFIEDPSPEQPLSQPGPLLLWYETIAGFTSDQRYDTRPGLIASVDSRQLPFATPKGFVALAKAGYIDDELLNLVSHVACFDFLSPGLDHRLRKIFAELISHSGRTQSSSNDQQDVLHKLLRIACLCVTIYQAQIISATPLSDSLQCKRAIAAAFEESLLADQEIVPDHNTDNILVWIIFVICITSRNDYSVDYYGDRLKILLPEAHLRTWNHIRSILLQFVFSRSLMEESCRNVAEMLDRRILAWTSVSDHSCHAVR